MKECKVCGSVCRDLGGGRYKCSCCGSVFSADDFINVKERAEIEAAKVRAAEEVKAKAEMEAARIKADLEKAKIKAAVSKGDSGADLFEKNINGVLEIRWQTGGGICSGSGFLINRNGYAVTNAHVVLKSDGNSCGSCTVKLAGETVSASVVAMGTTKKSDYCSVKDLAIIKLSRIPSKAKVLQFADYSKVRTGEKVFVIGNSLGQGTCITSGIVSDRMRDGEIMTDCPINGGNSGGPIFNTSGEVIGTIVASGNRFDGSDAEGMNYAIPSSVVTEFVKKSGINI